MRLVIFDIEGTLVGIGKTSAYQSVAQLAKDATRSADTVTVLLSTRSEMDKLQTQKWLEDELDTNKFILVSKSDIVPEHMSLIYKLSNISEFMRTLNPASVELYDDDVDTLQAYSETFEKFPVKIFKCQEGLVFPFGDSE